MHDIREMKPFAIFALNLDSDEAEHSILDAYFGRRWKQFEGCFKGVKERSYLVTLEAANDIEIVELIT